MSKWTVKSESNQSVFETENLKLVWRCQGSETGLEAIIDKKSGCAFALGISPLWELTARNKNGLRIELNGSDTEHFSYEVGEQLILKWTNLAEGIIDVTLTGQADANRALVKWRINVVNRSADHTIWEVILPSLKNVVGPTGSHEDDKMLTSEGFGCAIPNPQSLHKHAVWERFHYPNNIVTMPYCAVQNGNHGLYIGLHDPEGLRKDFQYSPPPGLAATGGGNIDFVGAQPVKVIIPAPDSGRSQKELTFNFDTVMALFEGDWYDAALLFREWVQTTERTALTVTQHQDIPAWAKKVTAWVSCWLAPHTQEIITEEQFDEVFENLLKFKNEMGVEIGVHIYHWHQDPFDLIYPRYAPRPGFKEFVAKLQANGMHAMPYINGRLFDVDFEDWEKDNAAQYAAKEAGAKLDGKAERIIFETYGSKTPMAVMCTGTEYWQDKISDVISRLAKDLGVDGVYTDQIGAAWPELCADRSHNHQLRNGAWWNQGYYKMIDKVRQKMNGKELYLTTESNADPFTDCLGMLMVNSHRNFIVPAFPAVYGSTALLFGRSENVENKDAFRIMSYQNVVWGCQPGWFGYAIMNNLTSGAFPTEFQVFKNAAALFGQLQPYVHGGSMLRPPVNLAESKKIDLAWRFNGLWPENVDTIWSCAWELDGSVMTAVANADTTAQQVILEYKDCNPKIWWPKNGQGTIVFKEGKAYIDLPAGSCVAIEK